MKINFNTESDIPLSLITKNNECVNDKVNTSISLKDKVDILRCFKIECKETNYDYEIKDIEIENNDELEIIMLAIENYKTKCCIDTSVELFTINDICKLLKISRSTFTRLQNREIDPFPKPTHNIYNTRFGKRWTVNIICKWINNNKHLNYKKED